MHIVIMVSDVNIEFAHIYSDEQLSDEQLKSTELLKQITQNLEKENQIITTSILIDEFNVNSFSLCEKKMVEQLYVSVDFIGYESRFAQIADLLIKELPTSLLRLEYFNHSQREVLLFSNQANRVGLLEVRNKSNRHTCAILSAAWTLCRLGVFNIPSGAINRISNKPIYAKKVICILHEKYRRVEEKALALIGATRFSECINQIQHFYFQ